MNGMVISSGQIIVTSRRDRTLESWWIYRGDNSPNSTKPCMGMFNSFVPVYGGVYISQNLDFDDFPWHLKLTMRTFTVLFGARWLQLTNAGRWFLLMAAWRIDGPRDENRQTLSQKIRKQQFFGPKQHSKHWGVFCKYVKQWHAMRKQRTNSAETGHCSDLIPNQRGDGLPGAQIAASGQMNRHWLREIQMGCAKGSPVAGWFIVENPNLKWMIWGYPHKNGKPWKALFEIDCICHGLPASPLGIHHQLSSSFLCFKKTVFKETVQSCNSDSIVPSGKLT